MHHSVVGVGTGVGDADDDRFLTVALGQRTTTALEEPLIILTILAGFHRLLKPGYHITII